MLVGCKTGKVAELARTQEVKKIVCVSIMESTGFQYSCSRIQLNCTEKTAQTTLKELKKASVYPPRFSRPWAKVIIS